MPDRFRFQGQVYRAHNPKWAWDPESGEGARLYGGRFNPPGMPALYTSMDYKTAWLEAQQAFPFKPQPLTLCAYDVDCEGILDLTQQTALNELGLGYEDLAGPWEDQADRGQTPTTHSLARRLIDEGVAGVIVPSFAPGADAAARNLVFWDWGRRRPHFVRVIDDEGRLQNQSGRYRAAALPALPSGAGIGSSNGVMLGVGHWPRQCVRLERGAGIWNGPRLTLRAHQAHYPG